MEIDWDSDADILDLLDELLLEEVEEKTLDEYLAEALLELSVSDSTELWDGMEFEDDILDAEDDY